MELLYRFEGRLGDSTPIGSVGDGVRFDNAFAGSVTDGALAPGRAWGMDYIRLRPDGVWVLDVRDVFEVADGHLHAATRGYVLPPPGLPPADLREILRPGSRPPDVRMTITAVAVFETGVPRLARLNRVVGAVEGWVNLATGELVFEGRALGPVGAGSAATVARAG